MKFKIKMNHFLEIKKNIYVNLKKAAIKNTLHDKAIARFG